MDRIVFLGVDNFDYALKTYGKLGNSFGDFRIFRQFLGTKKRSLTTVKFGVDNVVSFILYLNKEKKKSI
jgi:hypothetical protein